MPPVFSIIHATLGRPKKAIRARRMWFKRATAPARLDYIFGVHAHDALAGELRELLLREALGEQTQVVVTDRHGSAPNYVSASRVARGQLLLQAQDDLEPPEGWDRLLLDRLEREVGPDWANQSVFVCVADGYRKDRLCITSIMTRPYEQFKGGFGCADYHGVYFDDENTYRAYRDARDGNVRLIEARELVFRHRHHAHDASVPVDATYEIENATPAYILGRSVFAMRNPHAVSDGLKTW